MAPITSFIRWAGGKSWLVPYVQELTKDLTINNYFEPFMGGASIFFAIDIVNNSMLSDINAELVNMFCAVRDNPKRIIKYLTTYTPDEETYYRIRGTEVRGKYQRAARFLFLNANSFNGLYRVNKQGKYNVPYGQKQVFVNTERLFDISRKLENVEILCQDFEETREHIHRGDLIFLDPPYTVSKDSNGFIEYNSTLFSLDDQYRLAAFVEYINEVGAYFILTNAAHETIAEIFRGTGRRIEFERNSLIGGKNSFRGKVKEYIFTNIPERS